MSKAVKDMTHAELVALSRENAARYDATAAKLETEGNPAQAKVYREWARLSREEADMQENAVRGAAPGSGPA